MSETNILRNFWNSINNDLYYEKVGLCKFHSRRKCMKLIKGVEQKIEATSKELCANEENPRDSLIKIKDPRNHYMILWNCMVITMVILACAFIPVLVGFRCPFTSFTYRLLLAIDFTFALDIIMTFHIAYYHSNTSTYVFDRNQIFWNYLNFWFWFDFIGMFPFDLLLNLSFYGKFFVYHHSFRIRYVLRLLYILKLTKINKIYEFKQILLEYQFHSSFISGQSLALRLFFVSHCISCVWNFIATFDDAPPSDISFGNTTSITVIQELVNITTTSSTTTSVTGTPVNSWVYEYGFDESSVYERYVASLYWSITTMLTVGYGDIHAVNSNEKIFSIFIELFGVVVFGAIVAQMVEILKNINPRKKAIKLAVDELMSYLHEYNKIPQPLMVEAKAACVYFMKKSSSYAEADILEKLQLPDGMLQYFISHAYGKKVTRIELFKRVGVDNEFILDIVTSLKPFLMQDHDIILNYDDVIDELVFVMTGSVQMIINTITASTTTITTSTTTINKSKLLVPVILGQISPGGYFGDMEYEKVCLCLATYRANGRSSLYSLTYVDLNNALERLSKLEDDFHRECNEKYEAWKEVTSSGFTLPINDNNDKNNKDNNSTSVTAIFQNKLWIDGNVESNEKLKSHHLNKAEKNHLKAYHLTLRYDKKSNSLIKKKETYADVNQRWILEPQNSYKLIWDNFICLLLLYCIFSTTIILCFNITSPVGYVDLMVDLFFLFDIIIVSRTAYINENEVLVTVFPLIMMRYLKRWFWVDLVSSIPFDLMTNISGLNLSLLKLFKIFRVFRFLKLNRIIKIVHWIEDNWSAGHGLLEILKLMISVVMVSHIVACLWWVLPDALSTSTWFDTNGLRDSPLTDQYLTSLYWTVTTLTTVGYGDIAATNSPERIIACFVMILGGIAFGYIVGNLSSLLGNMNPSAKIIDNEIKMVRGFLEERSLPPYYVSNVLKYFRNKILHNSVFDEEAILSKLPTRLDREILNYRHAETIESLRIFKYIPNRSVVLYLFRHIEPHLFQSDTIITKEKQAVSGIIMIITGKVSLSKAAVITNKFQKLVKKQMNVRANKLGGWRSNNRFTTSVSTTISVDEFNKPSMFGNFPKIMGRATRRKSIFPEDTASDVSPRGDNKIEAENVIIGHKEAGELIGPEELMAGISHKYTTKAVLPTNTYVLSQSSISTILTEAPVIGLILQQALVSLIIDLNLRKQQIKRRTYRKKFITEILDKQKKLKQTIVISSNDCKTDMLGLMGRSPSPNTFKALKTNTQKSPSSSTTTSKQIKQQEEITINNNQLLFNNKLIENVEEEESEEKVTGDLKDNNSDRDANIFGALNNIVNNFADCLIEDDEKSITNKVDHLLEKYIEEENSLIDTCHEHRNGLQLIRKLRRSSSDPILLKNEERNGKCEYLAKAKRCVLLSTMRRKAMEYPSLDIYKWEYMQIQRAVRDERKKSILKGSPLFTGDGINGTKMSNNMIDIVNMASNELRLDFSENI